MNLCAQRFYPSFGVKGYSVGMILRPHSIPANGSLSLVLVAALFLALLSPVWGAESARSQGLDRQPDTPVSALLLDGLGKGAAPLDGWWQFHLGDDPNWAQPGVEDATGQHGWEQLAADKPWGAQGHESYEGFAWYRRHLEVRPAAGVFPDFSLLLTNVEDVYEVYWNGTLVGRNGRMPPDPVWFYRQAPHIFGLGKMTSGVLAVRVWKAPFNSFDSGALGGFEAVPLLGSPDAILAAKTTVDYQWLRSRQFTFALDSVYGLMVVLGLLAWLRNRKQLLLFWMMVFSLSPVGALILTGMRIEWPYSISLGLLQPVLALEDIGLWFLLLLLLQLDENRLLRRATWVVAIISITSSSLDGLVSAIGFGSSWTQQATVADAWLTVITTAVEVFSLILVGFAVAARRRLDPARWMVAACAFVTGMISAVQIAAEQGMRFTHWTLGVILASPIFTVNGNVINAQTIARTLLLIALIYAVYRYSIESRRRQAAMEQEYKNARELQQVLVPEELPPLPGFALTSAYRPAQEVGGDFFQIIPAADGATLVILGDVSGKGLKAAMAVSLIVGATRMIAEYTNEPAAILEGLNRRLYGRLSGGFATAIAMRLDAKGNCTLATAGHPAPFLNQRELDLIGSLPLGLIADASYEEHCFKLHVGDHFALYTDGLLEARSRSGELYGFARLATLFASRPSATEASQAAVTFGQDDDITVLTLTRLATGEESSVIHSNPSFARS
jgi:hypothetical protein